MSECCPEKEKEPAPQGLQKLVAAAGDEFSRTYIDFLEAKGKVTLQTLNEVSNALSHLLQFVVGIKPQVNLERGINHINRANLDLHKLRWAAFHRRIGPNRLHHPVWERCFSEEVGDVRKAYDEFVELSQKARLHEAENIGRGEEETLKLYRKATCKGKKLSDSLRTSQIIIGWGLWGLRGLGSLVVGVGLAVLLHLLIP